jgi:hypothetical protein
MVWSEDYQEVVFEGDFEAAFFVFEAKAKAQEETFSSYKRQIQVFQICLIYRFDFRPDDHIALIGISASLRFSF